MNHPEVIYLKAEYQKLESLWSPEEIDMWFNGFKGYCDTRKENTYPEILESLNRANNPKPDLSGPWWMSSCF